jgi:hypothetical protein
VNENYVGIRSGSSCSGESGTSFSYNAQSMMMMMMMMMVDVVVNSYL